MLMSPQEKMLVDAGSGTVAIKVLQTAKEQVICIALTLNMDDAECWAHTRPSLVADTWERLA